MPETKASMVRWGRMCPMLLRINPMNMKKRLTRGNGVADRIISNAEGRGTACWTTVTFLICLIQEVCPFNVYRWVHKSLVPQEWPKGLLMMAGLLFPRQDWKV